MWRCSKSGVSLWLLLSRNSACLAGIGGRIDCALLGSLGLGFHAEMGQIQDRKQCHIGDGSWLFGAPLFVHFFLLADKARWLWEAAQHVGDMGSWDVLHDLSILSTAQSPSKALSSSAAKPCGLSTVPVATACHLGGSASPRDGRTVRSLDVQYQVRIGLFFL